MDHYSTENKDSIVSTKLYCNIQYNGATIISTLSKTSVQKYVSHIFDRLYAIIYIKKKKKHYYTSPENTTN